MMDLINDIVHKWNGSCLNCHYFRFAHFERWCSHPMHHKRIENEYLKCDDWCDMFEKGPKKERIPLEETLKNMPA